MAKIDQEYHKLLDIILNDGFTYEDPNRKGINRIQIPSYKLEHNFSDGFPAITTKKLYWRGIIGELIWFLRGDTNIKYLLENNINIWNEDAYNYHLKSTNKKCDNLEKYLDIVKNYNPTYGNLGRVYGAQWRNWRGFTQGLFADFEDGVHDKMKTGMDQISNLIKGLKETPMGTRHMVTAWNPDELDNMALPPCFIKGTKIETKYKGFKDISQISRGEKVLTEDGSFQEVYDLHKTKYNGRILNIRTHGSPYSISCTPNHPFLVKDKGYINAENIKNGDYLGIKIPTDEKVARFNYKINHGSSGKILNKNFILNKPEEWYFLGYFLGDGWIQKNNKYFISIADKDSEKILSKINNCLSLSKLSNSGKNCCKYTGASIKWNSVLKQFGRTAKNKRIPEFIFNGQKELVEKFIEGYVDADGTNLEHVDRITTISDNIAFGIQRLASKIGKKTSLYYHKRPNKTVIEGREVNQNNTYSIDIYKNIKKSKNFIFTKDILWMKVNSIDESLIDSYVYNLSVKNNHTYTAYNLINHNCHWAFEILTEPIPYEERYDIWFKNNYETGMEYNSSNTVNFEDDYYYTTPKYQFTLKWHQRSVDTFLGLPFNIASYALLAQIIGKMTNMIAKGIIGDLSNVHLYEPHLKAVKEQLSRNVKKYSPCQLNISEEFSYLIDKSLSTNEIISNLRIDMFELKNYESYSLIKVEMLPYSS